MKRRVASVEEHPKGSGRYRVRARVNGAKKTIASDIDGGAALCARDEQVKSGRVVYFARSGLLLKIGWSDDPVKRCRLLSHHRMDPVVLLATFPGGRAMEQAFHSAFRDLHHAGEWFHYTGPLKAAVSVLQEMDSR